jgi:Cys-tRNA(Pro)/Cys-tRNA(Cys) deacylase
MAGRDTPATRAARAAGVDFTVHEYTHDAHAESYALEAATALALELAPADLVALTTAEVRPLT